MTQIPVGFLHQIYYQAGKQNFHDCNSRRGFSKEKGLLFRHQQIIQPTFGTTYKTDFIREGKRRRTVFTERC